MPRRRYSSNEVIPTCQLLCRTLLQNQIWQGFINPPQGLSPPPADCYDPSQSEHSVFGNQELRIATPTSFIATPCATEKHTTIKCLENLAALQAKSIFNQPHSNTSLFQRLQDHTQHCLHQGFPPRIGYFKGAPGFSANLTMAQRSEKSDNHSTLNSFCFHPSFPGTAKLMLKSCLASKKISEWHC